MFYGGRDADVRLTFTSLFTLPPRQQIDHISDTALHVPSQYTVTLGSEPPSYQSSATERQLNLAAHDDLPRGDTHLLLCLGKFGLLLTATNPVFSLLCGKKLTPAHKIDSCSMNCQDHLPIKTLKEAPNSLI